jgi:CHAT domain-containing protein
VPFGALVDRQSNQFLFERTTVSVAPNLAFALAAPSPGSKAPLSAVAIGEPMLSGETASTFQRLPRAKAEAVSVVGLYGKGTAIVGDQATKARVLDALASADIVHFAGHAVAVPGTQIPKLLLAGDVGDPRTALSGEDLIGRMTRPARVVLAACETAWSDVERGAGLASLSAAFLRGGAASVVANLWEVDDSASEHFFLNVHRAMADGLPTSRAVARAQQQCRTDHHCRGATATWMGATVYGAQ